jgi:hypothetical protein
VDGWKEEASGGRRQQRQRTHGEQWAGSRAPGCGRAFTVHPSLCFAAYSRRSVFRMLHVWFGIIPGGVQHLTHAERRRPKGSLLFAICREKNSRREGGKQLREME